MVKHGNESQRTFIFAEIFMSVLGFNLSSKKSTHYYKFGKKVVPVFFPGDDVNFSSSGVTSILQKKSNINQHQTAVLDQPMVNT